MVEPRTATPDGRAGPDGDGDLPPLPQRVLQVFVSPGRLFDRLRERPAWVGALLLVVGVGLVWSLLIPEDVLRQGILDQAPPDADPQTLESMTRFSRIGAVVSSAVGPLIACTVIAGVLLFVYNLVLGGESTFKRLFSVTSHALLIQAVGTLVTVPLILSTGDLQTALALHLLAPGLEEGFAFRLLRGLTVFGLWTAAVLGVGVSRLYPARSAGSSAATLLALYVAMKALFAALGGLTA